MDDENDDIFEEEDSGTLMYHVVFKGGGMLRVELPIDEVPQSKDELVLARNVSPVVYYTGAILDWNQVAACVPDYSTV
jgi:hypothetical protein